MEEGAPTTAFQFPGQGSQELGMGKALAAEYDIAADTFAEADDIVGFALSELCWEGPESELNDTINTQPAILTHSVAALRVLQQEHPGIVPVSAIGHSMGEFSALVAAGSVEFTDALRLVRARGEAMRAAGERSPGGMLAVLGMDVALVDDLCGVAREETGDVIQLANDNCPGQQVVSGGVRGIARAQVILKEHGAKQVVPLFVSIAAHSALMEHAQEAFDAALAEAPISDPQIPVYGNVGAAAMHSESEIREELSAQLTSPVRWTESVEAVLASGVTRLIELGPKNVLSKLAWRIGEAETIAIGAPADLTALNT